MEQGHLEPLGQCAGESSNTADRGVDRMGDQCATRGRNYT